jgi:hypothetical protein
MPNRRARRRCETMKGDDPVSTTVAASAMKTIIGRN